MGGHHAKDGGQFYSIAIGLIGTLSVMVGIAAGLGVLNTVLMTTRDRVHDLGIYKALGMRPGQVLTMVVCWIAVPAVIAGAIAAPAAVALNTATVRAMAATAHTGVRPVSPRCSRPPAGPAGAGRAGARGGRGAGPGDLGGPGPPGGGAATE